MALSRKERLGEATPLTFRCQPQAEALAVLLCTLLPFGPQAELCNKRLGRAGKLTNLLGDELVR